MRLRPLASLSLICASLAACGDDGTGGAGGGGGAAGGPSSSATGDGATSAATSGSSGGGAGDGGAGGSGGEGGSGGAAPACADLPLGSLEDAVEAGDHPCGPALEALRGRIGEQTIGSFVVWSRRTASGLGLVVSAAHTLGGGWFGPVGMDVEEGLVAPGETGVLRLFVPEPDGTLEPPSKPISPMYDHFHLSLPAEEHTPPLFGILPAHDAFIALVDLQRLAIGESWPDPDPLTEGLVPLHDPESFTTDGPTHADPVPGEQVLLVGFPVQGYSVGAFSVGPVLDDAEAEAAIEALAAAGDEEGSIPYDPEVEFLVRGESTAGMSGGGAFDTAGRFLGTLVRASQTPEVPQIVRFVRMSHVEARYRAAIDALDPELQAELAPFLEGSGPPG